MSVDFYIAAGIAAAALILSAAGAGRSTTGNNLGILIDGRGRFSLTRLQISLWTILTLSTVVGVSLATVKIRLHRGRERLRAALAEACSFSTDERGVVVCEPKPIKIRL